jgi:steroid delta-isomerase
MDHQSKCSAGREKRVGGNRSVVMRRSEDALRDCNLRSWAHAARALCLGVCLSAAHGSFAFADDEADKMLIADRLNGFSDAFNARNVSEACDLFAPDLVAIIPLGPDIGRDKLCGNLGRLLSMQDLELQYDRPEIREIIISGDIAVVRVVWRLTAKKGNLADTTQEGGLDVFRRQPDGRWSIARMAAVSFRPNKVLDE